MISNDDEDKNRRKDPFDSDNRNKEFERIIEYIEHMMKQSLRDAAKNKMRPGDSIVHGFNINIGPDGKPNVRQFGNYPRKKSGRKKISVERNPIEDVIETKKNITVTIELPDVIEEEIDIDTFDDYIAISVDTPQNNFYRRINLPCIIKPKMVKSTFINGILDISLKKK